MPKDHRKSKKPRREPLLSSAPVLLAAMSLLSASLGVSGTTPAKGSESVDIEENTSKNAQRLAEANLQSNQQKLQRKAGKGQEEFLQSNQIKLERKAGKGQHEFLQSNQIKLERKAGKGQQDLLQSNQIKLDKTPSTTTKTITNQNLFGPGAGAPSTNPSRQDRRR
jgi:flagellar motor protein MotB